jgi:hypothetical protein
LEKAKKTKKILAVGLSIGLLFSFATGALAAQNHTYAIKGLGSTSATSGFVGGLGDYGHSDAGFRSQGTYGDIATWKVVSFWPDTKIASYQLSNTVRYNTSDIWMDLSGSYYLVVTGTVADDIGANLWNYK